MPTATAISEPPPADLPAPAYVVLGMVRLGAKSGYEIKRAVERSIRFFWTISQAQIYPSLARLESAGLIVGRADPRGNRPRRTFEITARGEAALEAPEHLVHGRSGQLHRARQICSGHRQPGLEQPEQGLEVVLLGFGGACSGHRADRSGRLHPLRVRSNSSHVSTIAW